MPAWLRDAGRHEVRRGGSVGLRWTPADAPAEHEVRLTLVVHQTVKLSTFDLDVPGQFGAERQLWAVHDRAALDDGEARLRVPADAPYSYPGKVLAFFWGVALARTDDPDDGVVGWRALRVLP